MKILAFTDTHGSSTSFRRIEQKVKSQNPDILVCAGDLSIFEHGIIGIMRKLNKLQKRIIMVHGNHEDERNFSKYSNMFKNIIFIHQKCHFENDILFLGYGGDGFSVIDRKFERLARNFTKIIRKNKDKKIILLTHAPPYNTKVDKLVEGHCGNKSIRSFIDKNNISLMICGHLHENFGVEDNIKKTKIINPGPFGKIINV